MGECVSVTSEFMSAHRNQNRSEASNVSTSRSEERSRSLPRSHHAFWPKGLAYDATAPETNLFYNLEVSAARYPNKPFALFFDQAITYGRLKDEAERLAGYLQHVCGVAAGDRVMLLMQNSPQFVIAYYAVIRANAIVVPINPMSVTAELEYFAEDSGARVAIVGQEVYPQVQPLLAPERARFDRVLVATYSDYVNPKTDLKLPEIVAAPRASIVGQKACTWMDAIRERHVPGPLTVGPDDLCVIPYSSGTTGRSKGCMLTHRNVMHTLIVNTLWFNSNQDSTQLVVLPFFHVTSMQGGMNAPIYYGGTIVLMCRWDRELAAQLIERYRIRNWTAIATMVVDFLANPRLEAYDISSLERLTGGGAAMPSAVAERLEKLIGAPYVEGYGLTETAAPTHINPVDRPKPQCLGIPVLNTDSRVIDPETRVELAAGHVGEIVTRGPQVFNGYWRQEAATREAFVEIDGERFFRTGDLGYVDDDGYFFLVDRLKRMINASGFKVWPAEVEAQMYRHPAIQEACVIAAKDEYRGETVKALVVLREAHKGKVTADDIIEWTRANMAHYKCPRIVQFVDSLPKSATGKVQWRVLQEAEKALSERARA
jgi:fatty-acyl-CoA synthase